MAGVQYPSGSAPADGMIQARWSSAHKQFFGTAYEAYDSQNSYSDQSPTGPISRVWFTGATGVLTEVFWPSVDTAQVIDSQFLVSDGKSFFFEERQNSQTKVEWLGKGIPAFHVTNSDPQGRFTIEKTIFADPDRDVVVQRVRITRAVPGLKFYYLHKPAVSNTPMGNSAQVSLGSKADVSGPHLRGTSVLPAGLYAWQDQQAQAVIFSAPLKQVSAGFTGVNDGYQDIHAHQGMTYSFETAPVGNVTVTAWIDLPETVGISDFDVALGFGTTTQQAGLTAQASLDSNLSALQAKYMAQWQQYQDSLFDLSGVSQDGGELFRASIATLKASEDKTHAGAFVASPTVPWGLSQIDNNAGLGMNGSRDNLIHGYHLIWPRDLYQIATSLMAVKDNASAIAALNFLKSIQETNASGRPWTYSFRTRGRDGTFPQNSWTNGEPCWGGLQLDEVSMPIVLAYRLWKQGAIQPADYWNMVQRAADFVQDFGPWSPMERWEDSFGASPSTISSEIAGLRAAAEFATQMNDWPRAQSYKAMADNWASKQNDNIETWTYTTTGSYGNGHYYTRIQGAASYSEVWNPNSNQIISLANGAGTYQEKDIIDGGFLELVRFGVRTALDPAILSTIPVYDATIRTDLPGIGPGYRRYSHDRYNYDEQNGGVQTDGMIWPIFTGERGHYDLERALESGADVRGIDAAVDPYIQTMEKMSTAEHYLPEQIWDSGARVGQTTGSATPLGWSHAEYLKLLRSRNDRTVFDRVTQAH